VENNTHRVLDLLDSYGVKATFFVLGCVAKDYPSLVQAIQQRGHEVASHGFSHTRIYTQSPQQFREETRSAKKLLEDIIGQPVLGYRAASYSITERSLWALDILVEEGFRYDSSIFPVRHDFYGIPGHQRFSCAIERNGTGEILEIPLSTVRLARMNLPVGGGGYLRLFPYAVTRRALMQLNLRERQPAVVYFHPWEIDPDQPRIESGWVSHFRHYTNLRGMEGKLRKLLSCFAFGPIRQVFASALERTEKRPHAA
jgi:polysaccharide deacetylase family protein (PEP-CTERM system associated)